MATTKTAPKTQPPKPTAKQTALVKNQAKTSTGLVPVDESVLGLLVENAGAGLGNAQASDFALPFIYLLQKMSPALDEIDGAEAGMFLNTVTRLVTEETTIIPVDYDKVFNEWIPRNDGGGFVASHRTSALAEQNRQAGENKAGTGPKTQIVETANHYVLEEQPDGSWMPAILSLTSTKLKASRQLMSRISQVTAVIPGKGTIQMPSFAKKYTVKPTGPHENDKGKYFSVEVVPVDGEDGWVKDPAVVQQAISFAASLKAGAKGADFSKMGEEIVVEEVDAEEKASGKKKF